MSISPFRTETPLILTRDMTAAGLDSTLRTEVGRGNLKRLRRGVYVDSQSAKVWEEGQRYRAQVRAVLSIRPGAVATGLSAAALLGLPMIGRWPREVLVLSPGNSGRRRNGVVEVPRRGFEEVTTVGNFWATSVADTLLEVCRTAPFLTAVTMVDAAICVDRYGSRVPLAVREELEMGFDARQPFRGGRQARRALDFAATGADTPFESLSRVVIDELGFPEPALQHPLWLPRRRGTVFCDFAWPEYRVDGEADGWGKYSNPEYGPDISMADRVRMEKRRENEVRGVRWIPARWEWDDAWLRDPLRAILLEAGLPIVRRRRTTV